ncbi:16S rRNA (cytosine(1402)-N(4))-methyltransferase RsmH [Propioniciclava soli]|uniref:16S rRNA (cytosine(1402)-N(4))-methyltransferase RsmH n=1 Tax=Propioniciclava soli TaxID=2775081 RepID=UPI001E29A51D|nr:16S rRNA (cytosine(1402)-N(4))-methyltransferase RsmH [Propioniciclava soli]
MQAAHQGHVPVMLDRIVALLAPALASGGTYVDGTLGLAGHAVAVLDACPQARLVGIDRDPDALEVAGERLARFGDRVTLVRAVYDELPDVLDDLGTPRVEAILADLGLSSLQIDRADRGFAYAVDAPLDMRMGQGEGLSAADVVNTYDAAALTRILRTYGEERFADRIARRIVTARAEEPFTTSARLVQVLSDAIPAAARASGGHPAKRTFQALRIEVNGELDALAGLLPAALAALAPGGRLAVLAYHSLEDRLVKQSFAHATTDTAPRGLPVVPPEHRAKFRQLTRGAERPDAAECATNPRAASARLRATERLKEVAA